MKILAAACLLAALTFSAYAQIPGMMEAPPKPKPVDPIIPSQHAGPGRIGVTLIFSKETGLPQIAALIRGGPAADFGFRVGDVIIKIDRNYTNTLTDEEVKLALHGDPGTGVELTVQRGDDPHLIIRAVERRVLPDNADNIPDPNAPQAKP
jgi:C-terminal processing protease CtpA/Prc